MSNLTRPGILHAEDAPIQFVEDTYLPVMVCPKCGFEYTHINVAVVIAASGQRAIVTANGEDEGSSVKVEMAGKGQSSSSRRHDIRLIVHCEAGCVSSIIFTQHKGTTFVEIV